MEKIQAAIAKARASRAVLDGPPATGTAPTVTPPTGAPINPALQNPDAAQTDAVWAALTGFTPDIAATGAGTVS